MCRLVAAGLSIVDLTGYLYSPRTSERQANLRLFRKIATMGPSSFDVETTEWP